ncbi:uncharacterized protein LOC116131837 [Pistacia vera]|uniref:uncharacterized protein LOC116131837 n=1 Tax=Pistacia vera TaxID=55513 RepID=UPI001262C5D5|nr:uncharacterized protein LOC116131837 [Pistacia vera]
MELSSSIKGEFREDQYKDWLIDIKGEMEPDPDQCCIYRVPTRIRNVNKEAYTPQVVSIGTFHYGKKELEFMEKQKGGYVRQFFKRTTRDKREEVFVFIKDHEQQIRNCYSETCKLDSHEYVMMILGDALFIIELLLRDYDDDDATTQKSYPEHRLPKFDKAYRDVDLPSAAKLRESGVKFKSADQVESLFDIRFDGHELKIPPLPVDNMTETILRNLMALEQCHYPYVTPVCDYVELLDSLIDDKSDLDLLVKEGIISNRMGDSKAIVSLFNNLCTQITINRVYYNDISQQLKAHYDNPWNHTSAKLKSVYFGDLWKGTATVAAALILLLTFIQTMSSVTH